MRGAAKGFLFLLSVMALSGLSYGLWFVYKQKKASGNDPNVAKPAVAEHSLQEMPTSEEVAAFEQFQVEYSRVYDSEDTKMHAFTTFVKNLRFINAHNDANKKSTLKMNEFGDVEPETFKSMKLGLKLPKYNFRKFNAMGTFKASGVEVPESVDWRTKGAVTPVKNQGACGSCWSFSTTGALEGRWFTTTGKLCSLSEQQFVDCDTRQDHGCNGGLMDFAFEFAEKHALCSEESFPYHAKDETCPASLESTCDVCIPKGSVTGFQDVQSNDVDAMKEALSQGPVSVAIEADQQVFQFYHTGVVTSADCGTQLDHGVLAVGYGTEADGTDYWLVKNSWGATWGQEGYVKIARALSASGSSECGILSQPSFPVMSKDTGVSVANPFPQEQQKEEVFI